MIATLETLIRNFKMEVTGIIHVGAHYGEEYAEYKANDIDEITFIEASKKTFAELQHRMRSSDVRLYNCALGADNGKATMYVETANKGQSNSLLKPAKHLEQFPDIIFEDEEEVFIQTLDGLIWSDKLPGNMLVADVQGYELEVLKGSKEALKRQIDYVYLEVNRDEVYEGCARIEQLDEFLEDFTRVWTAWEGGTWGDALWVRTKISYEGNIVKVPHYFQPIIKHRYPEDNFQDYERYFFDNYTPKWNSRVYLPIFWTAYYMERDYGKDKNAIDLLQQFINKLDKNKRYFTLVQYDDGILNDISGIDLKVFGTCKRYHHMNLLTCLHQIEFKQELRRFEASFIGKNTHPIREEILKIVQPNWFITSMHYDLYSYCKMMHLSKFVLCPRGYGEQSFRVHEALMYGAVPVIITDSPIPSHWAKFAVIYGSNDISLLPAYLKRVTDSEYVSYLEGGRRALLEGEFSREGQLRSITYRALESANG